MTDRLTALDATFLELEEADESAHMHIGALMVLSLGGPSLRLGSPPSAATSRSGWTRYPATAAASRSSTPAGSAGPSGRPTSASRWITTCTAQPCPLPAASASCSDGSASTGPSGSTGAGPCGRSSSSKAWQAGAGHSRRRRTTAWSTVSAPSTRRPCCSTRRAAPARARARSRRSRTRTLNTTGSCAAFRPHWRADAGGRRLRTPSEEGARKLGRAGRADRSR
jgi:hypothetical protein